jgi:hypothetical protein
MVDDVMTRMILSLCSLSYHGNALIAALPHLAGQWMPSAPGTLRRNFRQTRHLLVTV